MTAHLVFSLRSPTLDADMDAARAAGTLVNAWRLDDGREDESACEAVARLARGVSQ
jgi:streptomycin 6-kinase